MSCDDLMMSLHDVIWWLNRGYHFFCHTKKSHASFMGSSACMTGDFDKCNLVWVDSVADATQICEWKSAGLFGGMMRIRAIYLCWLWCCRSDDEETEVAHCVPIESRQLRRCATCLIRSSSTWFVDFKHLKLKHEWQKLVTWLVYSILSQMWLTCHVAIFHHERFTMCRACLRSFVYIF